MQNIIAKEQNFHRKVFLYIASFRLHSENETEVSIIGDIGQRGTGLECAK